MWGGIPITAGREREARCAFSQGDLTMKKRVLSAALCLLLLLSCGPCAFADVIYPAPGDVAAGSPLEHLAATVAPESSVNADENTLPAGISVETDSGMEGTNIYLRGTPDVAGQYYCVITVAEENVETSPSTFSIPVHVTAAVPELQVSDDVVCSTGDTVDLSVSAYTNDGAQLSYQWFVSTDGSTNTSIFIDGANQPVYQPSTGIPGVYSYYCVVTNSNNGEQSAAVSPVITVTVQEQAPQPKIAGIELASPPTQLVYSLGDMVNTTGLRIRVTYSDGSVYLLDNGYTIYPTQLTNLGDQEISVSYEGYSCSFYATVEQSEVVTGIEILTLPYKLSYNLNEYLDTTGMTIRAFTNLGFRDENSGFQCNPVQLTQSGTQTIAVYYEGYRCDFTVQVAEAEKATGITIFQMPRKTSYLVGEYLDTTGLALMQSTSYGNNEVIYNGFTVSPTKLDRSGQQEITVQYNGLTCSFRVSVSQPQATPAPTVWPSPSPATWPSPSPTVLPTAFPSPSVQPSPSSAPMPSPSPQVRPASRQANMAKTLVAVIICSAVLALGVLGAYLYLANRGGFEEIAGQIRDLFRRKK